MARYYRRFVQDLLKSHLLTKLTKKGVKYVRKEKYNKAFEELKQRLTIIPVLAILYNSKGMKVYSDALRQGLGYVLIQSGRMIEFTSRQLRPHERNYSTHDLALAVIIHALKIQRYYLLGQRVEIYTSHKSLKYIFTKKLIEYETKNMVGVSSRL